MYSNEQRDDKELFLARTPVSLFNIKSPRTNLTFSQLKIFYEGVKKPLNEEFETTLELRNDRGDYNYLAYLLSDNNTLSYTVAKYKGKNKVKPIDRADFEGSIIKVTHSILDKFKVYNEVEYNIDDSVRDEKYLFDRVALRELVLNALVHNNYSNECTPQFDVYDDRIEIISNGSLPNGLTKKQFFAGGSRPRNRELIRVYKDLGLVEQLGSGVQRVLEAYPKEVFHFEEDSIEVIIPIDGDNVIPLNDDYRKIIDYILEHGYIKRKEVEKILGLGKSRANDILREMSENQLIESTDEPKYAYVLQSHILAKVS